MDEINNISSKYHCIRIRKVTEEFKFVKDFLNKCRCKNLLDAYTLKDMSIYKVVEDQKTHHDNANNLMLFHGTSFEGVKGIIKDGLYLLLSIKIILRVFSTFSLDGFKFLRLF